MSARLTHRVVRAMPTGACENDRVPQKVVDQVVVKVAARKAEFARYQIGYYMGLQQKHTQQLALGFTTRGKSRTGEGRGFGFYGLKGSSALIMPHLKLPCHTLAQFSISTNQPHPCMQTPKRR